MSEIFTVIPVRKLRFISLPLFNLLVIGLIIFACLRLIVATVESAGPTTSIDAYVHWYAGLAVLEGNDPYTTYAQRQIPTAPINHLDGRVTTPDSLQFGERVSSSPALVTPPYIFLTAITSLFSWSTAKVIFIITNLLLFLIIPLLAWLYLKPLGFQHHAMIGIFAALIMFSQTATVNGLVVGQPVIIITFLMYASLLLLDRKHLVAAGILVGIAVSKYSVALPLILFLLYKRQYKVLLVAASVQILGLALMSLISGTSPMTIVQAYLEVFNLWRNQMGIHIAGQLLNQPFLSTSLVILITTFTFLCLLKFIKTQRLNGREDRMTDMIVLSTLLTWSLLIVYHRSYDLVTCILPFMLLLNGITDPLRMNFNPRQLQHAIIFIVVFVFVTCTPGFLMARYMDEGTSVAWIKLYDAAHTICLLGLLAIYLRLPMPEWSVGSRKTSNVS